MKKTYKILSEISNCNSSITHFLFRLYKKEQRSVWIPDIESQYQWISVQDLSGIESIILDFEQNDWTVGLTSIVMTSSGIQYLLMLDYSIEHDPKIEEELFLKLNLFNKSGDVEYRMDGYLIKTNKSYHYLGKYITSEESFVNFLGSALLFRHADQSFFIVDDRWLGHSLKKKFGTIRIGKKYEGEYPFVIKEISS